MARFAGAGAQRRLRLLPRRGRSFALLVVKRFSLLAVLAAVSVVICLGPGLLLASWALGDAEDSPSAAALREIPRPLLVHYQGAPGCRGLPWQVVAAIGYVESRHATTGGALLDQASGDVSPSIVGIALDGSRSAAIRVPAGGSPWHDDPVWDHAVGPMQFITATWTRWGIDASGDGHASPHNAYDAIATAGRYLCGRRAELPARTGLIDAVHRYNSSASYLRSVLAKAYEYGMTDGGDPVIGEVAPPFLATSGLQIVGDVAAVVAYAVDQIGDPYVWGGDGPDAFDCSGLTMVAYREAGIRLPHRADLQVRYGASVDWRRRSIRPGDLIFLRGGSPVHDYGHVGLAVDARRWVVAPRSGESVQVAPIPFRRVQAVRRLITPR